MKAILFILIFVPIVLHAQEDNSTRNSQDMVRSAPANSTSLPNTSEGYDEKTDTYRQVEEMPEFPGGLVKLLDFIGSIKYPKEARKNDIEGTVYINFIIDKKGRVTDLSVSHSSGSELLDNTALEHLKKMPDWKPGMQRDKPVKVMYTVPIKFKLTPSKK